MRNVLSRLLLCDRKKPDHLVDNRSKYGELFAPGICRHVIGMEDVGSYIPALQPACQFVCEENIFKFRSLNLSLELGQIGLNLHPCPLHGETAFPEQAKLAIKFTCKPYLLRELIYRYLT